MGALDPIAGIAVAPATEPNDAAKVADDATRAQASRVVEAMGFDLLFAALLGTAVPAPDGAMPERTGAGLHDAMAHDADTATGTPDTALATGGTSSTGARTIESASYAARRDGIGSLSWLGGAGREASPVGGTDAATAVESAAARATLAAKDVGADRPTDVTGAVDRGETRVGDAARPGDVAATPTRDDAGLVPVATPPAIAVAPAAPASPIVPPVATTSHDDALETVAPELRTRLERVIDRMQREFGHDVRAVEGRRSQARQDALYAQGRTAPGPIVTWTRDSAHRDGHAVDVMIDGGYGNAAAFRTLSRIAAEEGLRSLGPRDPGHLELADGAMPSPPASSASTASSAGVAQVARVAAVAQPSAAAAVVAPAAVTAPASVARVATPGVRASAPAADRADAPRTDAATSADVVSARSTGSSTRESSRTAARERVEELVARLATPLAAGARPEAAIDAAVGLPGVNLAGRLEAIARVRDAQAAQPLSRLVMDVPDAIGGVDRIAVSLRGQRLDASLAIQDAATASRVADRVAQLAEALGARGYEAGQLAVSAARGIAPESLDLTRLGALALEREGTRGVASILQDVAGGGLRERQGSPGRQHDPSTSSREHDGGRGDTPRRQPRREPGDR